MATFPDLAERLEAFRRRHGVAAVGAATLGTTPRETADDPEGRTAVAGVIARGVSDEVVTSDAWHIGSCTKPLTAALYARLVEQGRAEWGARVADLLHDVVPSMPEGWSDVTIDALFTCRSGLPVNPDRATIAAARDDPAPVTEQRSRVAQEALARPLDGHGEFRYSNLGFVLAGAIIDRIAGASYEETLRTELLDPLGVTTAGFGPPPRLFGHWSRLQIGDWCIGRGAVAAPDDRSSDNPSLFGSAGGLHLSVPDWARVQRVFLDGAGMLSARSVEHLLRLPSAGRGMAMGWAPAEGLDGPALATQGSNAAWAATAVMNPGRDRMALVITNDGRTSMLRATALLAVELLVSDPWAGE